MESAGLCKKIPALRDSPGVCSNPHCGAWLRPEGQTEAWNLQLSLCHSGTSSRSPRLPPEAGEEEKLLRGWGAARVWRHLPSIEIRNVTLGKVAGKRETRRSFTVLASPGKREGDQGPLCRLPSFRRDLEGVLGFPAFLRGAERRDPQDTERDCKDQVLGSNFSSKLGSDSEFGTWAECLTC